MIFGAGAIIGGAKIIWILKVCGAFFIILLAISATRFKKHIFWKVLTFLSILPILIISWTLAPLIVDLRPSRELKIDLSGVDSLVWVPSDVKCTDFEFSSDEYCETQDYINHVELVLPDMSKAEFTSDIIHFTKENGNLVNISLRTHADSKPKQVRLIYERGLTNWLTMSAFDQREKIKHQTILAKLDKLEKGLPMAQSFGYRDKVCVNKGKYLACMSLYGKTSIQITRSISFNNINRITRHSS